MGLIYVGPAHEVKLTCQYRYAVWLYYRFNLSHRDIEDLLAQRGITVSREAIRLWCIKFGAIYTFFIDEVFVRINGKQHYLWRAVDQDGEVVDVYLQARRDGAAAKRFLGAHPATVLARSASGYTRGAAVMPCSC